MFTRRQRGAFRAGIILGSFALWAALAVSAFGQKATEQARSMAFVPEDTAAYGAMLHNKDMFDAVAKSKAWGAFAEMESVAPMLAMAQAQWQEIAGNPGLKGPVQVLLDGLSDEVFYYADPKYVEFMTIYQQANNQSTFAPMIAAMQGREPDNSAQLIQMLNVLSDNVDKLQMFDMVIGLRVKDADAAKGIVPLAEVMLNSQLEAQPDLKKRLKHETVGDTDVLTLKLDGSMVPWDALPLDDATGEPGKYDSLIAKLKTLTIAISLCVKGEYLLLSVGDTNEHIATLANCTGIIKKPEMAKLAAVDGKKLASVQYGSAQAMQLNADQTVAPLMALLAAIPEMLPATTDDMLRRHIDADLQDLTKDLKGVVPKAGAYLTVSTFSPTGFDTLTWNWTIDPMLDGSKPLTLLDQVGGDPIAYYVARGKQSPDDYATLVKWLKKLDGYATTIIEDEGDEDEIGKYKKFRTEIAPLLGRLDVANRELLQPALADGQAAFVFDAKLTSTQWFAMLPESPAPLPMPELGLVWGVTDAAKLTQGSQEYFAVASAMLQKLHEASPDDFPEVTLPPPQEREFGDAKIHFYMLPKDWGVDKRVAPNAGLTESVAALSLTPLHTKRLLEKTPLVATGPLAQLKSKPLVSAGGFNFAALVDASVPWIEYGLTAGAGAELPIQVPGDEIDSPPAMLKEIKQGAEILKCFRGYSAATYREGNVEITTGQWHFEDLK